MNRLWLKEPEWPSQRGWLVTTSLLASQPLKCKPLQDTSQPASVHQLTLVSQPTRQYMFILHIICEIHWLCTRLKVSHFLPLEVFNAFIIAPPFSLRQKWTSRKNDVNTPQPMNERNEPLKRMSLWLRMPKPPCGDACKSLLGG